MNINVTEQTTTFPCPVDKLKGTSKPLKVTNNTMFVGSTKELQQMLKQRQSEDE